MAELEDDSVELSFEQELLSDIEEHLRSIRRSVWWIAFVIVGGLVLSVVLYVLAVVFVSVETTG